MKKSNFVLNSLLSFVSVSLFMISISQASAGGGSTGGGDQCKNEIDKDRLAILNWIESGDAKDLDFSKARVQG